MIEKRNNTPWLALLFLVVPTVLVTYPFLGMITEFFHLLQIPKNLLLVMFAVGAGASFVLHGLRIRFLILSVLVIGAVYLGRKGLNATYVEEFDSFYWESRYEIYSAVFLTAWFTGYGLLKSRYFPIIYGVMVTVLSVIFKARSPETSFDDVIWSFFFVLLYVLYLSFVKEVLEAEKEKRWAAIGVLLKRTAIFGAFAFLCYWLVIQGLEEKTGELREMISQTSSEEKGETDTYSMLERGGTRGTGNRRGNNRNPESRDKGRNGEKKGGEEEGNTEDKDGKEKGMKEGEGEEKGAKPDDKGEAIKLDKDGEKIEIGIGEDDSDGGDKEEKDKEGGDEKEKDKKGGEDEEEKKGRKGKPGEEGEGGELEGVVIDTVVNTYKVKKYAEFGKRFDQNNDLMFVAHMENIYYPGNGGAYYNPLYYAFYHLNQYNAEEGRFEIDENNPYPDIYTVDPSRVPLYFKDADSAYLSLGKDRKFSQLLETEVYMAGISSDMYLAPSTAFACQPITVDEEFQDQFHYAYKSQSYVSRLNSAYLGYKPEDEIIQKLQKDLYWNLRKVKNYDEVDSAYMAYYTKLPEGALFDSIKVLADELSAGKTRPIDKAVAIQEFFNSNDKYGQPRFEYNLVPGFDDVDKNIPNSERVGEFLFNTGKGYCTYFAGSALFILRSMGIPARMTTGFAVVDRSHGNPGWYWFYGKQAHAWVQIYFPEYGWMDFDYTIGDRQENNAPPRPDGTPPITPQKAKFAGQGIVVGMDTAAKTLDIALERLMWDDDEVPITDTLTIPISIKDAKVLEDKEASIAERIEIGDSLVIASYAESLQRIRHRRKETAEQLLKRTPQPLPVSEIHLTKKKEPEPEKKEPEPTPEVVLEEPISGWVYLGLGLFLALLTLSWPYWNHRYYVGRVKGAKTPEQKAYFAYRHALFTLNQFGMPLKNGTIKEFAMYTVDPKFATQLAPFIDVYLKTKYSQEGLNDQEEDQIDEQHPEFYKKVWTHHSAKQRFLSFIRLDRTMQFLLGKA